jgi:hypothetical protein
MIVMIVEITKEGITITRESTPRLTMNRLSSTKSASFAWAKTGKLSWSLLSDGRTYATIKWAKRWGSLATGESADGKWTLKRAGFVKPRVTVRQAGSDSEVAVVQMDWSGGGLVTFSEGVRYQLRKAGFWKPEWVLFDSYERKIMVLKPHLGVRSAGASLEIQDGAVRSSWRASLLAIIAWYLSVLVSQYDYDGGASAAAVMAAIGA